MKTFRAALVMACLALPACYEFEFPLDPKPSVPLDSRLPGAWRCLGTQADLDESPATLRIAAQADLISRWSFESLAADGTPEKSEYDVHASTVKGGALLNVRERVEKADAKWSFVRYSFLLPDVLRVQLVRDEPFSKIMDAKGLRSAVEKKRNDPSIYSDFMICVRGKAPDEAAPTPSPTPVF